MPVLRSVCAVAAARLPLTGVAVAIRGRLVASEVIHATAPLSHRLEELQLTIGEGPSLEVLTGRNSILVDDLAGSGPQARWPVFAPQAVEAGARGFFVLPLRIGAIRGGAFALCAERPGTLQARDLAEAWVFSELALELLLDGQAGIPEGDAHPRDRHSGGRPEVHQAAGMISVQLAVSVAEAFVRLRARAFGDGRPLSELAADVVARRVRFGDAEEDTG